MKMLRFSCLLFLILSVTEISAKDCKFGMSDLEQNHPLLLNGGTTKSLYPQLDKNEISLRPNTKIELACPGSFLEYNGKRYKQTEITFCTSSGLFSIGSTHFRMAHMTCSKRPKNIAQFTNQKCFGNIEEIEIGFQIDSNRFKRIISICFDDTKKTPVYTKNTITKFIYTSEVNIPRPEFVVDKFYRGLKVNDLYKNQQVIINQLLGLPANDPKYIDKVSKLLQRGHLSPKTDFVDASEQYATFHYVNSVPQWKNINEGNWFKVETRVKNYASTNKINLHVYTGTHGILKLPHEVTNAPTALYLFPASSTIPVPKLIWKIVYSVSQKKAVVIVSINNPFVHHNDIPQYLKCTDRFNNIQWLKHNLHRSAEDYIYACDYNDFKRFVGAIPNLNVNGLLL